MIISERRAECRSAVAAMEFAVCLPFMFLVLAGAWEVGRMTEVQAVAFNAAREAARDASLSVDNLNTVASNALIYLQAAEPQAFGSGHATVIQAPTVTLPSGTAGLMVWDNTANRELFTLTYADLTQPNITPMDPQQASKLDVYQIGIQIPYATISMNSLSQITGITRMNATVTWVSMRDTPFSVNPVLPAQ